MNMLERGGPAKAPTWKTSYEEVDSKEFAPVIVRNPKDLAPEIFNLIKTKGDLVSYLESPLIKKGDTAWGTVKIELLPDGGATLFVPEFNIEASPKDFEKKFKEALEKHITDQHLENYSHSIQNLSYQIRILKVEDKDKNLEEREWRTGGGETLIFS